MQVVEVSAEGRLTKGVQVDLGDVREFVSGRRRLLVRNDTLWVDRAWPREKVTFDVSDPSHPRLLDTYSRKTRQALDQAAGFFYATGRTVALYDVADMYPRRVPTLVLERDNMGTRTRSVTLRNGYAYALMDDKLAVFRLPERKGD